MGRHKHQYIPFAEARAIVRSFGFRTMMNFTEWSRGKRSEHPNRLLLNIPSYPDRVYVNEWAGWADFLGTVGERRGRQKKQFTPFNEARAIAHTLGLRSIKQYKRWARGKHPGLPKRSVLKFPSAPEAIYDDWISWADFLGTDNISSKARGQMMRSFEDARTFARSLKLTSVKEYSAWCAGSFPSKPPRPKDIPSSPNEIYSSQWISWPDFLGYGFKKGDNFYKFCWRPFGEAREYVRKLGIKSFLQYRAWIDGKRPDLPQRPIDIPSNPYATYGKSVWTSWPDFLGTENVSCAYIRTILRPYAEARAFVRTLGFRSVSEYQAWCSGVGGPALPPKPKDLVRTPYNSYPDWISWADYLGCETIEQHAPQCRSFEDARRFVRTLGLSNFTQYIAWANGSRQDLRPRPADIPKHAYSYYKDSGWVDWSDFLGSDGTRNGWRNWTGFRKARVFVKGLGLLNQSEYMAWCKGERPDLPMRPADIPSNPYSVYQARGWRSWGDFLGIGSVRNRQSSDAHE